MKPKALPIEPLPASGLVNGILWRRLVRDVMGFSCADITILGIGKPSVLALQLLSACKYGLSFYDAMDSFPEFYGNISRMAMARREGLVGRRVTRVFVSSTTLMAKWSAARPDALLVQNGVEIDLLPEVAQRKSPSCPAVIGYIGTIGEWFDWHSVFAMARARPDLRLEIIGSIYLPPPDPLPPNVNLRPPVSHEAALAEMARFDIGLIPFKRNLLTASVDPIKYYEYRSLGLPVISSRFGEMSNREKESGVFLIDDASGVDSIIDSALAHRANIDDIERFRRENDWKTRFDATGLLAEV